MFSIVLPFLSGFVLGIAGFGLGFQEAGRDSYAIQFEVEFPELHSQYHKKQNKQDENSDCG